MRIVHLSDIHLSTIFKKSNLGKTKKLLKYALDKGFDHLVITGDISDNSEKKDYLIFRKILKSFDLLDSKKTSIIIGNHDIFGGVQTALDVVNFPAKCLKTNYEKKVTEFVCYFKELFENCYSPLEDNLFPYSKIIGDTQLIGLNTIDHYSRITNPFASNGKVYKDQIEGIMHIFSKSVNDVKHKIVMSHHHFYKNTEEATSSSSVWNKIENYTLKLRGKKKLLKFFKENGVNLILHGHSHEVRQYERKGLKLVNAGGSIDNSFSGNAFLIFVDVDDSIQVSIKELNTKPKRIIDPVLSEEYVHSLAS